MKFALVGIGKWGQTYLKVLQKAKGCELVATCSTSFDSYNALPPELKTAPHFTSLYDVFKNTDVDTVIIATHPDSHYNLAKTALWFNKNVICEKPCMFDGEQFSDIERSLNGKIFFTNYTNLAHKVVDRMVDIVNNPENDIKANLTLVNVGCGPVRKTYSDKWDYGSHVGSIIYSLFPAEFFYEYEHHLNEEGNYVLTLASRNSFIVATYGNKAAERKHSFELSKGGQHTYWLNDRSEDPLRLVLEKFAAGKIQSNLGLSVKVKALLSKFE